MSDALRTVWDLCQGAARRAEACDTVVLIFTSAGKTPAKPEQKSLERPALVEKPADRVCRVVANQKLQKSRCKRRDNKLPRHGISCGVNKGPSFPEMGSVIGEPCFTNCLLRNLAHNVAFFLRIKRGLR
jgi:hypothetical protein